MWKCGRFQEFLPLPPHRISCSGSLALGSFSVLNLNQIQFTSKELPNSRFAFKQMQQKTFCLLRGFLSYPPPHFLCLSISSLSMQMKTWSTVTDGTGHNQCNWICIKFIFPANSNSIDYWSRLQRGAPEKEVENRLSTYLLTPLLQNNFYPLILWRSSRNVAEAFIGQLTDMCGYFIMPTISYPTNSYAAHLSGPCKWPV